MKIVTKILDFWLGDFKWYRDMTENDKTEWLCRHETTIYGQSVSTWERHPKGTFFMISIVKEMVQENPDIQSLDDEKQKKIVERYINKHYNQN